MLAFCCKSNIGTRRFVGRFMKLDAKEAAAATAVGQGGSSSSSSSRAVMKAHREEMDGALALGGCHVATTHNNQL